MSYHQCVEGGTATIVICFCSHKYCLDRCILAEYTRYCVVVNVSYKVLYKFDSACGIIKLKSERNHEKVAMSSSIWVYKKSHFENYLIMYHQCVSWKSVYWF